jgi:cell division protein FtsL
MPARKVNNMYYEDGSAARKILPNEDTPRRNTNNVVRKKVSRQNSLKRQQEQRRKNASMVAFILCGFTMSVIITYRFSLINEKNLEVQNLINELETVSSEAATSQIAVDQNTDLNAIEAYAKQQLGMKKADSSQTVYIDTSESINKVQVNQETTFWNKIINYIKSIFL